MTSFYTEIQRLAPTALIELWELDLTKYNAEVLHFHAGTNGLEQSVIWQGTSYSRFPIAVGGFEKNSQTALPRPTLAVSNIEGVMGAYAAQYKYFLGCKLRRKRTFARFLDAANFPNGNPEADANQYIQDEVWVVDRKSAESPTTLEFELAASLDMAGVYVPRRQMIQNCCVWLYRGPYCGYTGGAVSDEFGVPTTDLKKDKCGHRLCDCKARYGANAILPYGGFPGCGLVRY